MRYPSPDLFAAQGNRRLAIECKVTKEQHKYIEKREIEELVHFAKCCNAEAFVAVRFKGTEWAFLRPGELIEKGKSYMVNTDHTLRQGRSFDKLIAPQ